MRRILSTDKHGSTQIKRKPTSIIKSAKYLTLSVFICGLIFFALIYSKIDFQKVSAEETPNELEAALFTRQEFFGAEAVVPFPTLQARENLAKLAETFPENREIIQKSAELDEKLGKFDLAETELLRLVELEPDKIGDLAEFYNRRAWFEKQAATLQKMLAAAKNEEKPPIFEQLIELARLHDLKQYLQPEFFQQVAKDNPDVYPIFENLIQRLTAQQNYTEALQFTRRAKANFPDKQSVLLEKEISLLTEMKQPKEAEKVYLEAFDVFWSDAESESFYQFLSSNERLRAYAAELRAKFKQNPADFQTAIRLAHYRRYNSDLIAPVILQLEKAKKDWSTEELLIVTRLLIQAGEGDLASRFLYTLHVKNELKPDSELRAKILYQLFRMFCEADVKQLSLAKGDLRFYKDIAKSDINPGITTGILSLIFSDSKPGAQFEDKEQTATKLFNRAAAYRVFSAYKQEFPTSPELAEMYLDMVTMYAETNPTLAEKTLTEFEQRYENSSDYARVALKLADAYVVIKQPEKERQICQKVLDYVGKQGNLSAPQVTVEFKPENSSDNEKNETSNDFDESDSRTTSNFNDYLGNKPEKITYQDVLARLVGSLAKEKKTPQILELYSNEIQKYPAAEWLYEQRLQWLEQTNLTEEQLAFYKTTLEKFPTRSWQDKLARWFVRKNRTDEFIAFSTDLVGKLNDTETQNYLTQFIDSKISSGRFDEQLYLKLYETAHLRFPHNMRFVNGLLAFYKAHENAEKWRKLAAEYYFESKDVRESFLNDLAKQGELRNFLDQANEKRGQEKLIYELFRADACVRLSNYEEAVAAYRELNRLYPNSPEFAERLVAFTRSFGQKNRDLLTESATAAHEAAEFLPSSADYRTKSGEIYAELGNYQKSREEWEKLIPIASGVSETYLDTATVYWDYFQYDDALRTIKILREKLQDEKLYAFEAGAILEAQHKQPEAVSEYVKALGKDEEQSHNAKKRLRQLSENEAVFKQINLAVAAQLKQRQDADWLALAYADFGANVQTAATNHSEKLKDVIKSVTAKALEQEIRCTKDDELLDAARDFYSYTDNKEGEQNVLKRLAEITTSPRQIISYRLRLAESLGDANGKTEASAILANLVQAFPTNYGVLTESSDFYWRLGLTENAVNVLRDGISRAKGEYKNNLTFRLAKRLTALNRLDAAEKLLADLHNQDQTNSEVFHELTGIYVREGKPELLRKTFVETVSALRKTDTEPREIDAEIAGLRTEMIEAFTKLGDYRSAVEQHIEIINREPDDEEKTEAAISYVKRHGGADTLIAYYQKTASEAYKNYRWNVVLARIYAANKDWENAVKNYQTALINQPEMPELYVALADIETGRKNYDAALKNINQVLELTNDEAPYVRLKIEILKKAGRIAEIEAEKAKLPVEEKPKIVIDQFAEARKLQADEKAKAVELYREGLNALLENPLKQDFKAADIVGYVKAVRDVEPLNQINERLWQLRDKFVAEAEKTNSTSAGEARNRLQILDGALTESIGDTARNVGTDEELAALYEDFNKRIDSYAKTTDFTSNLAFLQNVSHRAGFGNLEEKILRIKLESATGEDVKTRLQNLCDFYRERGAFQKVLEILEAKDSKNFAQIAEAAQIAGEREKELAALRQIYQTPQEKLSETTNPFVKRYLEILYADNRDELKSLTEKYSAYQLQLINFLLGKGEPELTHKAIESNNLSTAWKLARNAETSLALKEFDENSACYFCDALQINSIGEFISQKPESTRHLIGNDWFKLSESYGEWLYDNPKKTLNAADYLPAMTENLPKDARQQFKLGNFYLEKKDFKNAVEHFRMAVELNPDAIDYPANLGAAYYLSGDKEKAAETWVQVIADEEIESCRMYLETLQKYGLAPDAQDRLLPIVVKNLKNKNEQANFKQLIFQLSASFSTETAKTTYFQKALSEADKDIFLPELLIKESLIGESEKGVFYELLINRREKLSGSDYKFKAVLDRSLIPEETEEVYAQENDYKISESENERLKWQREYLEYLLNQRQTVKAKQLILQVKDELKNLYARPDWLRLAEFRLQIAENELNLNEAKQFIGIEIKADVAKINPPSIERFNGVWQLLKDEKREAKANQLAEVFFARLLACEHYEGANFVGLARVYFQKNEPEKAVKILQMMIDISNSETRETALAELDGLEIIKANAVDKTRSEAVEESVEITETTECVRLAAELSAEFGQTETAIGFRQKMLELVPDDAANKFALARLFLKNNNKAEGIRLLSEITKDRNAMRIIRWQAIWTLRETGENVEIKNNIFDSYSQFYNGLITVQANQNEAATEFFIRSLIADRESGNDVFKSLINSYVQIEKPVAALKTADLDKMPKPDDLLNLLSETAEKIGDFPKAIEFEKARNNVNDERIKALQEAQNAKNKRVTDLTVDLQNVRKL